MAIITTSDLKDFMKIPTDRTDEDTVLALAVASGENQVRRITGRDFSDAGSASARKFEVDHPLHVWVDDFSTTTGLVIKTDDDGDGTFEVTWSSSDYELHPLNAKLHGETWPYCRLEAVGNRYFPVNTRRSATLQVTARWGWASVPSAVKHACLILAAADERVLDLVRGEAGFTRWSREDATQMLERYKHPTLTLGIA